MPPTEQRNDVLHSVSSLRCFDRGQWEDGLFKKQGRHYWALVSTERILAIFSSHKITVFIIMHVPQNLEKRSRLLSWKKKYFLSVPQVHPIIFVFQLCLICWLWSTSALLFLFSFSSPPTSHGRWLPLTEPACVGSQSSGSWYLRALSALNERNWIFFGLWRYFTSHPS